MVALFNQELMKKATKTTKFMKNWHFFNIINCLLYMFFFSYIIWHNSMSLFSRWRTLLARWCSKLSPSTSLYSTCAALLSSTRSKSLFFINPSKILPCNIFNYGLISRTHSLTPHSHNPLFLSHLHHFYINFYLMPNTSINSSYRFIIFKVFDCLICNKISS